MWWKQQAASNSSQNVELMLQETSTHPDGGSLVVFATVDVDAIQVTMSGEDPSYILLLPLSFAIFPATNPSPAATSTSSSNGESTICYSYKVGCGSILE